LNKCQLAILYTLSIYIDFSATYLRTTRKRNNNNRWAKGKAWV